MQCLLRFAFHSSFKAVSYTTDIKSDHIYQQFLQYSFCSIAGCMHRIWL